MIGSPSIFFWTYGKFDLMLVFQEPLFWGVVAGLLFCRRYGGLFFAVVSIPATAAHEFAHLVVASLFIAHPSGFSLEPIREKDGWTLGSVSFRPNQLNGAFISLAPLYCLPPIALSLVWWSLDLLTWWHRSLCGFVVGTVLVSAWPSRSDWAIVFRYPLGLFVVIGLGLWLYWHGIEVRTWFYAFEKNNRIV